MRQETETRLRAHIKTYEELADSFQAQSKEARAARNAFRNILDDNGLEHCSHTMAYFGSKRYAKYLNKNLNRPLKKREWEKLSVEQVRDFENLTKFPFTV